MEGLKEERPHALLLPYPMQGHINPMMQLGKRLAALGVRVTLATIQHVHSKILRAQHALPQPITDCHSDFTLHGIPDGLPADMDRQQESNQELRHVIDFTLEEGALELVHTLASQGRPVTFIVGDFHLRWTCSLARRMALPEFVFWPQCASVFSIYLHLDSIIAAGYHPFEANVRATSSREEFKSVMTCIPGLPEVHRVDLPFEMPFGKLGLDWVQELLKYRFSHINEAQGLLINSFQALEEKVYEALHYKTKQHTSIGDFDPHIQSLRCLGPLVPSPFLSKEEQIVVGGKVAEDAMTGSSLWEEEVEECMQWLDEQPQGSVVLVAFGSLSQTSMDQVHELAAGLAASGQRVLWVIRENSITPANIERPNKFLETTSVELEEALPRGFLHAHRHTCKVVRWAPQPLVLSHPSVGGFFSHCGWNSTLEGICTGVPILGWPLLMDQVTNCWLLSHVWKIGLTLPRDFDNKASKADIESCVKQLMDGPQALDMRVRARELSKLAREAILESPSIFQSFFNDITRSPLHVNGKTSPK